ncbi:hypothetical protein [Nocardia sp. NBC_01329]|uniref:hypothetical protein n=1 Tax=Nocardia sp. NBC_01329 TaxID=2903594 RepID=UPI002E161D87|nr:hypothetical protein OG405_20585 [Nocardia sp. NBC_01329]
MPLQLYLAPQYGLSPHHGCALPLPSPTELLYAVGGRRAEGPVCRLASALSESYRLESGPAGDRARSRRRILIAEINAWSSQHLPAPTAGVRVYERTLGELIDVIAAGAARAFHLLGHDDPAGELMHAEWTRLAELQIAYRDLVHDIEIGRCCLPGEPHLRATRPRRVAGTGEPA